MLRIETVEITAALPAVVIVSADHAPRIDSTFGGSISTAGVWVYSLAHVPSQVF